MQNKFPTQPQADDFFLVPDRKITDIANAAFQKAKLVDTAVSAALNVDMEFGIVDKMVTLPEFLTSLCVPGVRQQNLKNLWEDNINLVLPEIVRMEGDLIDTAQNSPNATFAITTIDLPLTEYRDRMASLHLVKDHEDNFLLVGSAVSPQIRRMLDDVGITYISREDKNARQEIEKHIANMVMAAEKKDRPAYLDEPQESDLDDTCIRLARVLLERSLLDAFHLRNFVDIDDDAVGGSSFPHPDQPARSISEALANSDYEMTYPKYIVKMKP